tara:strand:- start:288 stop:1319 length:1032 start_codon:yes stop_codon:yes gene_type:complete
MIEVLLFIVLIFVINFLLKKKNLLSNNTGQLHQTYVQEYYVPLSGGLFILIFFYFNNQYFDFNLIIYLSIFFLLGLLTDLHIIKSPAYRFLLQILLLLLFLVHHEIVINDIRIGWFNNLLKNYYFNIFFVLFCFLVLINGTNFVDGNNGISLGYFLIIFILIFFLIDKNLILYEENFLISFIITLIILLIFNLLNQLYLGDSGAYLLSLFSGYILIDIFFLNQNLSPYFIVNIFWYPAFEILFSLIRKMKTKYSPLMPDTLHFHQLLFFYYFKKMNLSKSFLNSLTGLSINLFNGTILYFASLNLNNTKIQITFLFFSVIIYMIIYYTLLKFKKLTEQNKKQS